MNAGKVADVLEAMGHKAHNAAPHTFEACPRDQCVEARAIVAELRAEAAKPTHSVACGVRGCPGGLAAGSAYCPTHTTEAKQAFGYAPSGLTGRSA